MIKESKSFSLTCLVQAVVISIICTPVISYSKSFVFLSMTNDGLKVLKTSFSGKIMLKETSIDDGQSGHNLGLVSVTDGLRLVETFLRHGEIQECRVSSSFNDILNFMGEFSHDMPEKDPCSLQTLSNYYTNMRNISYSMGENFDSNHLKSTSEQKQFLSSRPTHVQSGLIKQQNKSEKDKHKERVPPSLFAVFKSRKEFTQLFPDITKYIDVPQQSHNCKIFHTNSISTGVIRESQHNIIANVHLLEVSKLHVRHHRHHPLPQFPHNHKLCRHLCLHRAMKTSRDCYKRCITRSLLTSPSPSLSSSKMSRQTSQRTPSEISSSTSSGAKTYYNSSSSKKQFNQMPMTSSLSASSLDLSKGLRIHKNDINIDNINLQLSSNEDINVIRDVYGAQSEDNIRNGSDMNDHVSFTGLQSRQDINSRTTKSRHVSRQKRDIFSGWMIFPGTKWCGDGDIADHKNDLGYHSELDMCCRNHDLCRAIIPRLSRRYGLFNFRLHTITHCRCDRKFRKCLQATTTPIAHLVGRIYFNVVGPKCFKLRRERTCVDHYWWGACRKKGKRKVAYLKKQRRYRKLRHPKKEDKMLKTNDYI